MSAQETSEKIIEFIKQNQQMSPDDVRQGIKGIIRHDSPDIISDTSCRDKYFPDPYYQRNPAVAERHEAIKARERYNENAYWTRMTISFGAFLGGAIGCIVIVFTGPWVVSLCSLFGGVGVMAGNAIFSKKIESALTSRKMKKYGYDKKLTVNRDAPAIEGKKAEDKKPDPGDAQTSSATEISAYTEYFRNSIKGSRTFQDQCKAINALCDDMDRLTCGLKFYAGSSDKTERLLSYYLPTVKNTMEKIGRIEKQTGQSVPKDMTDSLEKMTDTTDRVVKSAYSSLFEYDSIDMASEASVMEHMSVMDGITEDSQTGGN